jgi:hypothetical protein
MTHLLLKRASEPELYDARAQRYRILKTGRGKRCGTCTFEVPEEDIVIEDGQERCPMCRDTLTAAWKAAEEQSVAAVKAAAYRALFQPPKFSVRPLQETIPAAVTAIRDVNGRDVHSSAPLSLRINDFTPTVPQPPTLTLVGQRFTAADTVTLPAGFVNVDVDIVSTRINLVFYPGAFVASGRYAILFNGHSFGNIIIAVP